MEIWHGLKVIVFGMGNSLSQSIRYIEDRFEIVGCSDSNLEKKESDFAQIYNFYEITQLEKISFDYILVTSIYDDEIFENLTQNYHIAPAKVLRRREWCHLPVWVSYGDKCRDKKLYIISRPIRTRNGLMSYLFSALQQLGEIEGKEYTPLVDMQNFPNQYLDDGQSGNQNAWELYYKQLSDVGLNEAYKGAYVILGYDDPNYWDDYNNKYDLVKMHEMYVKYIKMQDNVCKHIEEEYVKLLGRYKKPLGVLLRGSDMVQLKLKDHPIQPTADEMIEYVKTYMKQWGCDIIYLSTEDDGVLHRFKETFDDLVVYIDQQRFDNTEDRWLAEIPKERKNDKYLRGLEYLTTIEILAKCDNMIASVCCGSVTAQIIHGTNYEHLLMIDKGSYK